jgi:hypothetical protein
MLFDLATKQWLEHHPAGTEPNDFWLDKWYQAIFQGGWNSLLEPQQPTLNDRQGCDSAILTGTLKVYLVSAWFDHAF